MMIDPIELQRLRDLPIEGVAQRLGLEVSRHKCLCPFHADKHPSLSFSTSRNTYRCWVCGASGGTVDLVMQHLHLEFPEACRWLADENNIILEEYRPKTTAAETQKSFDPSRYARFFEHPWLSPEAQHFLFGQRRLDPRVVSWCRLTSWRDREGVDWLQIPYFDMEGKLIGVQNRRLPSEKFEGCKKFERFEKFEGFESSSPQTPQTLQTPRTPPPPRFRFVYGSTTSIYNLPMLRHLQPGDECWIAEGSSDCWSLMSDRHKAIAIPSATLLQPKDKELLQRLTAQLSLRWRMAPDRDEPGLRLASQLKEILPMLQLIDLPEGCKDYSDYYCTQHP